MLYVLDKWYSWRRAGLLGAILILAWAGPPRAAGLECPETGPGAVPALVSQSQARLLIAGGSVDIANEIDELIVRLKVEHPGISYGDLTNALIAAYCPLVSAEPSLNTKEKLNRLQKFETLLRQRLSSEIMLPGSLILANVLLAPNVYRALRDMAEHSGQTPSELMAALLTKAAGEARD
jgi:hypothetical protein